MEKNETSGNVDIELTLGNWVNGINPKYRRKCKKITEKIGRGDIKEIRGVGRRK